MIRFVLCSAATVATIALALPAAAQDVNTPATITVSNKILRPKSKVPPLGAINFGGGGAIDQMANNYVRGSFNEPMSVRRLRRVSNAFGNSAELEHGVSFYGLLGSGFLSGANVRVYRLVDKNGKSLPRVGSDPNNTTQNLDKAASAKLVRTGRIIPEGAPGFPNGGWVASKYAAVGFGDPLAHNLKHTDFLFQKPGRTYYYVVTAVDSNGDESEYSKEISAKPAPTGSSGPRIVVTSNSEATIRRGINANTGFGDWGGALTLRTLGGKGAIKWELLDRNNQVMQLPEGMRLTNGEANASRFKLATARLEGGLKEVPTNFFFRVRVTDAEGNSDTRDYVVNPPEIVKNASDKEKPAPPRGITVVANTNSATLSWQPSPSPDVVGYRVYRSEAPAAKQVERIYLEGKGPALEKDDYLFIDRVFTKIDPSYTGTRVGFEPGVMGNFSTPWSGSAKLLQQYVLHDKALVKKVANGGKMALQFTGVEGENQVSQNVHVGTKNNFWYTQLEPGKKYRFEAWMRGEGIANGGKVTFDYNNNVPGYKDVKKTFDVTKEWQKFTFDFVGPAYPENANIFGHRLSWAGEGGKKNKLWIDNTRIFRYDTPADRNKTYVPNATLFEELVNSLPEGAKGSWRAYGFAMNQASMDSLLSYQADSSYNIDWYTSVDDQTMITLPMVMEIFYRTGKTKDTRVHPFLTMQFYHSEKEWRDFIEYLAAPYDPKVDTPKTKPYAFRRTQHRGGVLTPWTEEFPSIMIEYGNETWHNGVGGYGWEGYGRGVAWAPQEGREMGHMSRYFMEQMTKSPYWKPQKLGSKIKFNLGGFYNGNVEKDGTVSGYAENARELNPLISQIGHATYVGPKWETGDAPLKDYNDEGVLRTLTAYVADSKELWTQQSNAQKKMAEMGMPYDLTAYEGGPSGYIINGQDAAANKATEMYGKSLAMAVAALDGFLDANKLGWTFQNWSSFQQGGGWSSHTMLGNGFHPYPGWLAMKMRNRFGSGDMIAADVSGPAFDRKQGDKTTKLPLIGSYAFRDGNKYGVFVLSRKINGTVMGTNFGDGSTKTTLKLPFSTASKITLHKLTGDPRTTNIDAYNIKLQEQDIPLSVLKNNSLTINSESGGGNNGMPMGSIFLYIFEGAK